MSYATAPTFEANKIGVRRVYTLAGFGLGTTPDPDTIAELVANGYDPEDVQSAIALGATDEQLLALPYPADPVTEANAIQALIMQLGNSSLPPITASNMATNTAASILSPVIPSSSTTPTSSAPPTPSGSTASVVPAGSLFTYTVEWATSLLNVSGPSQILAQVNSILQQHGMSVANSSIPTTIVGQATGFTIVIQTSVAFGQMADVKSVCDGAVAQAGRQVVSSLLIPGGTLPATGSMTSASSSLSSWFESNWVAVAAVILGIAVLPNLVKKL